MLDPRFGRPADVTWLERALDPRSRSQMRHFATLAGAVDFTIQKLPAEYRGSARIIIDGTSIKIDEIELLFAQLTSDGDD